jgi:hypothetical protein
VEERKGGAREMQELEGILYRSKRRAEWVRLRRWAAVPALAAINGVPLGAVAAGRGRGRGRGGGG